MQGPVLPPQAIYTTGNAAETSGESGNKGWWVANDSPHESTKVSLRDM